MIDCRFGLFSSCNSHSAARRIAARFSLSSNKICSCRTRNSKRKKKHDPSVLVLYVQELNFSQTLPVAPHFLRLCGEFFRKTFFSFWHPELFVSLSGSSTFIHPSTLSLLDALYLLWREKIISWSFIIIISLTYSDFKAESEKWYFCQRGLSSFVDNSKTNVCFTFFLNHRVVS